MMHLFEGLVLLGCTATSIVQAASGRLEIDLIFPQNDTYSPQPIIPVAFAFQNSSLASFLHPSVDFIIYPYGNHTKTLAYGYFDMSLANFTKSDPYLKYGLALNVLNTEGVWALEWTVSHTMCPNTDSDHKYLEYSSRELVVFTTKKGAKMPNVSAATAPDTCANAHSHTFEITETRDTGDFFENRKPCAVLANITATPSPCGVKIDADAAANVTAAMTSRVCAVANETWCPEPISKENGAACGLIIPSGAISRVTFLTVAITSIGFLMI